MGYYSKKIPYKVDKKFINLSGTSWKLFEDGRTKISTGEDKIKENILTILNIEEGECFFNPSLGSGLQKFLFEPNDFILRDTLSRVITSQLEQYLDEIKVLDVECLSNDLQVQILIKYQIVSTGTLEDVTLYKERNITTIE